MMLFDKTGRPVAILGIAMLAGLLSLGGCSDSTATGSATGSGDKRNDPALKAGMEKSMEIFKSKTPAIKGNALGGKRRS
jgi:hypothetical protein